MFSARSRFLICVSALSLSMALPAFAQVKEAPLWEPVVDFTYKGGNNRHYGTASVMLPFAQNRDSLFFADIRTTISDQDTFEGNAGLGFRKIAGDDAIFGAYGFFDARESEYDNKFQQVTLGAEVIGEHFEARGNVYVPFGKAQKLAYDNGASAFISGSNIMIQDGRVYESSLQGFDVEIGHSFPVLDNARGYLGYYSFHNDGVSDVNGYRARVEADVGDWLSFGVEKQFSNTEQDDSVFGEVRLRVPFDGWSKGSTRRKAMSPLQQRMMVPIVRDIDIVTNALPAAEPVVVLGADGKAPSKVYFVDNTAAAGGDGSADNPFNTLAAAEAAAGNYDTIYVAAGDGTTTGYDAGVTLDNQGQRLIGSGVALTLDTAQIQVPSDIGFSGVLTLKPAQPTTPTITNAAGDGITITGDGITVSGLTVDNAGDDNVYIHNADNVTVENITSTNATDDGIYALYEDGGTYTGYIRDNVVSENNSTGIIFINKNNSMLNSITSNNTIVNNNNYGIFIKSQDNGAQDNTLNNNIIKDNGNIGIYLTSSINATLCSVINDNITDNNGSYGIYILGQNDSTLKSAIRSNLISNNNGNGLYIQSQDNNTQNNALSDNIINNNSNKGIYIQSQNNSTQTNAISGNTISSNNNHGLYPKILDNSTQNNTINGNTINNNSSHGIYIWSEDNGIHNTYLIANTVAHNNNSGIYIWSRDDSVSNSYMSNNIITANSAYGVVINNDSSPLMKADLGGGVLGSTGQNSIYENIGQAIYVDLDGNELKTENNWWGDVSGLQPADVNLNDGTIDADPYLTEAP